MIDPVNKAATELRTVMCNVVSANGAFRPALKTLDALERAILLKLDRLDRAERYLRSFVDGGRPVEAAREFLAACDAERKAQEIP